MQAKKKHAYWLSFECFFFVPHCSTVAVCTKKFFQDTIEQEIFVNHLYTENQPRFIMETMRKFIIKHDLRSTYGLAIHHRYYRYKQNPKSALLAEQFFPNKSGPHVLLVLPVITSILHSTLRSHHFE